MRLHLSAGLLVLIAGVWLDLAGWQWGLLLITITMVIFAEMVNTAIEYVVDLASPGYAELASTAKDVAAGAVLFTALAALTLGNLVFHQAVAPFLGRLREGASHLPPALAWACGAAAMLVLIGSWQRLGKAQRISSIGAGVVITLCTWLFKSWPSLPVVTGGLVVLFAIWVIARYRSVSFYGLGALTWTLLWLWLWQSWS